MTEKKVIILNFKRGSYQTYANVIKKENLRFIYIYINNLKQKVHGPYGSLPEVTTDATEQLKIVEF